MTNRFVYEPEESKANNIEEGTSKNNTTNYKQYGSIDNIRSPTVRSNKLN